MADKKKPLTKDQKKYYKYLHAHFDKINKLERRIIGNKKEGIKGKLDREIFDKLDFDKLYNGDKRYIAKLKKDLERFVSKHIVDQGGKIGEDRASRLLNLFYDRKDL